MQTIILAAGRGTRMGTLTDNCPKPMLIVLGKNLLEYKLEALPEIVNEIIFVVGYKKEVIQNYFKNKFTTTNGKTFNIKYVEQMELDGTMGALNMYKALLYDRFMVLMGEYGLPHTMLSAYEADENFQVFVVETDNWINITSPESIQIAEKILA